MAPPCSANPAPVPSLARTPKVTKHRGSERPHLPVLRLDVVGEGLGLLETVVVVVAVVVILGTNILHLVDAAALGASLDWSLTGHLVVKLVMHCRADGLYPGNPGDT